MPTSDEVVQQHPVQNNRRPYLPSKIRTEVYMRAYEVYCHCYGEQKAMVTDGCRGGFSAGELVAFLYAHSFPRAEWKSRVDEALRGMENI